jgi:Ni,Fe-hydrogenase maturation factor
MKIFCFGNPLVKEDRLPLEIADSLKKIFPNIEFIKAYSIEDVEEQLEEEKEIVIIDTVKNIDKIKIFEEKDIALSKIYSLHDFDIGIYVKLMKKMGKIKSAKIIGIPQNYKKKKCISELKRILKTFF